MGSHTSIIRGSEMNTKSLSNEVHLYHASLTTEKPVFADEADKYNFLTMFGKRTRVYGLHAAGFCLLDQAVHIMIDMEASGITGADLLKECFENDYCSYYQKRHQTYHQLGSNAYDGRIGSPAEEISWLSRLHMLPVWCGIVQKQRIQFMRSRGNHVKITKTLNQFGRTGGNPFFFFGSLAIRAVPVSARSIVDLYMPAVRADTHGITEFTGFAAHDALRGAFLLRCDGMMLPIGWVKILKDFADRIISHGFSPPCRKGW